MSGSNGGHFPADNVGGKNVENVARLGATPLSGRGRRARTGCYRPQGYR